MEYFLTITEDELTREVRDQQVEPVKNKKSFLKLPEVLQKKKQDVDLGDLELTSILQEIDVLEKSISEPSVDKKYDISDLNLIEDLPIQKITLEPNQKQKSDEEIYEDKFKSLKEKIYELDKMYQDVPAEDVKVEVEEGLTVKPLIRDKLSDGFVQIEKKSQIPTFYDNIEKIVFE